MNELGDWIDLNFTRYLGSLDRRPTAVLADMRSSLRTKADLYRASFRSRAGRLWAAQRLDEVLGKLLVDELRTEQLPGARLFEAIESLKARMLLDQMAERFGAPQEPETATKLTGMERQVMRFVPSPERHSGDQLTFSELRNVSRLPIGTSWDRGERRKALAQLEHVYSDLGCGFEGVENVNTLEDVQRMLSPNEMIIEYYIPFHPLHPAIGLIVLFIMVDECQVRRLDFEQSSPANSELVGFFSIDGGQPLYVSPLGSAIISARTAIQAGDDAKARVLLRQLHELLISPLNEQYLAEKGIDRLILVPHGMLHVVPFGALVTAQGRYLAEEVVLTVVPSATIWCRLAAKSRSNSSAFLGLANPRPKAYPLPASEREAVEVAARLNPMACTVFTREQASKLALRQNVPDKTILHIAAHGEFPELDAIDFHRILLAEGLVDDGNLNAEDVRTMDLGAVRTAVLSICNGGLYRYGPGDEPYGLIPAFLAAGARNVISTLWPLEDKFGLVFMKHLYNQYLIDQPAQALQQTISHFAGRGFFRTGAKLRQWASFVLVGAGRPFD